MNDSYILATKAGQGIKMLELGAGGGGGRLQFMVNSEE